MWRPVASSEPIDLDRLTQAGLPKEHARWLRDRLPPKPSLLDVDRLAADPRLSDAERKIIQGMKRTATEVVGHGGTSITTDGELVKGSQAYALRAARLPSGELQAEVQMKAELPAYLIGQEKHLGSFVRMTRAFHSTKRTPPLMVLGGGDGHGKDQALEGFAKHLLGPTARIIEIDLSRYSDAQLKLLFGDGAERGELSTWALQQIQDDDAGLIRLKGLDDLKKKSPGIVDELMQRLQAVREEPGYAHVAWVLDFDCPPGTDLDEKLETALGPAVLRLRAAQTCFDNLDADAMRKYGKAMIDELLDSPGLRGVEIQLSEDAEDLLGEVLATPFAPLKELEARVYAFIFEQFETKGDVPADALVRVDVSDELKDPARKQARIADFHKQRVKLFEADDVFHVAVEGRRSLDYKPLLELEQKVRDTTEELVTLAKELRDAVRPGAAEQRLARLSAGMQALAGASWKLAGSAEDAVDKPRRPLVSPALARALKVRVEELEAVATDGRTPLEAPRRARLIALLQAAAYVARAPELLGEQPQADEAARLLYAKNAGDLARALEAMGEALEEEVAAGRDPLLDPVLAMVEAFRHAARTAGVAIEARREALILPADHEALRKAIDALAVAHPQVGDTGAKRWLTDRLGDGGIDAWLEKLGALADKLPEPAAAKGPDESILDVRKRELADVQAAKRKIIRALVRPAAGADDLDVRAMSVEMMKLPLRVLKRLQMLGVKCTVIRNPLPDYWKDIPKDQTPPGYPPGTSYADVPGVYDSGKNELVVQTKEEKGRRIIPGIESSKGRSNTVIHEALHAYDKDGVYSKSEGFKKARKANYNSLIDYEKQENDKDKDRGPAETFAITGERLFGGDPTVLKERPDLVRYMQEECEDKPAGAPAA